MGQISFALWEGEGKFAGWVHVAEEDVGDCFRSSNAGIPGFDDGGDFIDPRHQDGATGFEHDDGVGIGGGDCFDQRILVVG